MNITICGHKAALRLLEENPNRLDILMLSSPDCFFDVERSHYIPKLARECKRIAFHDLDFDLPGYSLPTKEQIQEAIDWAQGREKIIVACQMGISRSSATAYVIKCTLTDPVDALNILDEKRHNPNMMVIRHGADILNKPEMITLIQNWKIQADEVRSDYWEVDVALSDSTDVS